jgi:hypothetical protein
MENFLYEMFEDIMFSNIFFVNNNKGSVKIENIIKDNDKIKKNISYIEYSLNGTNLEKTTKKDCLLNKFISFLNFNSNNKECKYFNKGFIKNIFSKKNPNELLELIKDSDHIITSEKIIKELTQLNGFEILENSNKSVKLHGYFNLQFKNIMVYQLPDEYSEDIIYLINNENNFNLFINNADELYYQFKIDNNFEKIIIT